MLQLLGLLGVVAAASQITFSHNEEWDLNSSPHRDSTVNFLFDSVASFLQQWPNTRYRGGHAYVPATIAPGTLLYHGRKNSTIPTEPDWLATDPEHSFAFCEPWHLVFVTKRQLNLLYLDGSSAAKVNDGSLDTQDLLLWNKVHEDATPFQLELARIQRLCEWGKEFGLDGFVRMEMDFEVMFCDFTQGIELVSSLELTSCSGERAKDSPIPSPSLPAVPGLIRHGGFHIVQSGAWHNSFPGETRIKLLPHQLVSFYDTNLVPSLIQYRRKSPTRWEHRAGNASTEDVNRLKAVLEQNLRDRAPGSGVDWISLTRVIIHRFAERLELLEHTLKKEHRPTIESVRKQARVLLAPHTAIGASEKQMYQHCATIHTEFIMHKMEGMTASERLILSAIRGTQKEICRVLLNIWLEIDQPQFEKWHSEIQALMRWLDWSVWIRCKPECKYDEMCYLPTWPWIIGSPDGYHPKPHCIKRLPPYTF